MMPSLDEYEWLVISTFVCGVLSECWIIGDDMIWLLSRKEREIDTFVLHKKLDGRVSKMSDRVNKKWRLSITSVIDSSLIS